VSLLDDVIAEAADPLQALLTVERLRGAGAPVAPRIEHDPLLARAVARLSDASRSLTDAVVRTPALLVVVDHLVERDRDELVAEATAAVRDPGEGLTDAMALRRWKRREFLRVALRDLLGLTDLPGVGRELAALADACLAAALQQAAPDVPMAIIAMGKLGGEELNYASDVDVLFVHDGDEFAAARAARRVIALMADPGPEGIVFRTDADLRPDGRSGALSRTVAAYGNYYDGRALTWERQALLKARRCAGDADLARRWFDVAHDVLWNRPRPPDAVRDLRAVKERSEELMARRGLAEREVKRGRGGIRDVEMAVQILQYVHGGADPAIRSATTLVALDQLARRGYVDAADAEHLSVAYRHLRTVEHRLQLDREQQVYALPADEASLDRLARVMGHRDLPGADARTQFLDGHRRHQASVRSIFERLFFRPLLEGLSGRRPWEPQRLGAELAAFGFTDLVATRAAVDELTAGSSRHAVQMRVLLPQLLEWLSVSPNPDLGLLQLRIVLDGPVRAMTVIPLLRESEEVGRALCTVLGSSKVVGQGLRRHPDAVAELADLGELGRPAGRDALAAGTRAVLDLVAPADGAGEGTVPARTAALARFADRSTLRSALRELLVRPDDGVAGELSDLADVTVAAVLEALEPDLPFAVIAMGKHGGRELAFASDLDVVFVHDGPTERAELLARRLLRAMGGGDGAGRLWEIDARLRPEGNQGILSRTPASYAEHYERRARPWERQALIKARFCAGDAGLGARFEALRDTVVFGRPPGEGDWAELRHVKHRVDTERVRDPAERARHLKAAPGAMVDVEFAVQYLQLRHGAQYRSVRQQGTSAALAALVAEGLVEGADAEALRASLRFCDRARNAAYLRTGRRRDLLPTDPRECRDLDRLLGLDDTVAAFTAVTGPARAVIERLSAAG
jgi:glutamate-ammonia-ligase adenylyltransferase